MTRSSGAGSALSALSNAMEGTADNNHQPALMRQTRCRADAEGGARDAAAAMTAEAAAVPGSAWKRDCVAEGDGEKEKGDAAPGARMWYWTRRKAAPPRLDRSVDARERAGRRATVATEGRSAF